MCIHVHERLGVGIIAPMPIHPECLRELCVSYAWAMRERCLHDRGAQQRKHKVAVVIPVCCVRMCVRTRLRARVRLRVRFNVCVRVGVGWLPLPIHIECLRGLCVSYA